MKKICKSCNGEFTSIKYQIYCSSKCAKYGTEGVLYPDPNKKYKYQLNDVNGKHWHYKW